MSSGEWFIFLMGGLTGGMLGGFVGSRWYEWVEAGIEWFMSLCTAVGLIAVAVGGFAMTMGWRPW